MRKDELEEYLGMTHKARLKFFKQEKEHELLDQMEVQALARFHNPDLELPNIKPYK